MKIMRYLEQKAQGMVEYALILAFVVGIAAALTSSTGIKGAIEQTFTNVKNTLNNANSTSTQGTSTQGTSTQGSGTQGSGTQGSGTQGN